MKIPKTLRAFGYDWNVVIDKKIEGGSYIWKEKKIVLGDKLNEKESVFIHELLEAVIMDLGYRYYGQEGSMEYVFHFDHTGLVRIHQQLYRILKDNKII